MARDSYRRGLLHNHAKVLRGGTHRFSLEIAPDDNAHMDGMTAISERLAGWVTHRRWTSNGNRPDKKPEGDLYYGVSVRWTPRLDGGCILHEDECEHLRTICVVGPTWDTMRIVDYVLMDARQPRWWRTKKVRHPCFIVPQDAPCWHPLSDLILTPEDADYDPSFTFLPAWPPA